MRRSLESLLLVGVTVAVPLAAQAPAPRAVTVRMTLFAFVPDRIHVSPGDTIRFVHAEGTVPHNVEFTFVPAATRFADAPKSPFAQTGSRAVARPVTLRRGPVLTRPGQVYELVVTDDFAMGTHHFVCANHERAGMKGALVVQARLHD